MVLWGFRWLKLFLNPYANDDFEHISVSTPFPSQAQNTLKLIGTSFAYNGKFVWIELNGEDFGWTREDKKIGKYKIVIVEMGKVLVESNKKTVLLLMLGGYTI